MAIGTALTNAYVHISCAMQACELFAWRDRPQALRHVHGLSRFLPSLRELGAKQALDILEERPLAPIWRGEGSVMLLSMAKLPESICKSSEKLAGQLFASAGSGTVAKVTGSTSTSAPSWNPLPKASSTASSSSKPTSHSGTPRS